MKGDQAEDPKGLIHEAYRIEGITAEECRTIFLDWALSLPVGLDSRAAVQALLAAYGPKDPDHPMTGILRDGDQQLTPRGRRGGWKSRKRD